MHLILSSLVVVLVAIAFFVCVLILPERRRRYFKDLLRVENLKAEREIELELQNPSHFSSQRLSLADEVSLNMADPHSFDESLFNGLEHEPSSHDNEAFDPDDVDSDKKHLYLKRTEVVLKPRTLPDFNEIVSYDPNHQPIYRGDVNSKESAPESSKSVNTLKPDAKRKDTRDAVQNALNCDPRNDDKYVSKPVVTKEDEDYKEAIQVNIPGLSITRPSVDTQI